MRVCVCACVYCPLEAPTRVHVQTYYKQCTCVSIRVVCTLQGCTVSLNKVGIVQRVFVRDARKRTLRLTVTSEAVGGSALKVCGEGGGRERGREVGRERGREEGGREGGEGGGRERGKEEEGRKRRKKNKMVQYTLSSPDFRCPYLVHIGW